MKKSKNHISQWCYRIGFKRSHSMRRTCFSQYQASSAMLEWLGRWYVTTITQTSSIVRWLAFALNSVRSSFGVSSVFITSQLLTPVYSNVNLLSGLFIQRNGARAFTRNVSCTTQLFAVIVSRFPSQCTFQESTCMTAYVYVVLASAIIPKVLLCMYVYCMYMYIHCMYMYI